MSNPRRIKVKRVEAADPELRITMQSQEPGETFPSHVKVRAEVTWEGSMHVAQGINPAVSRGAMEATVDAMFTGASFGPNQFLDYVVTDIWFSTDGVGWTQYTGTIENASGTVSSGMMA
ncbi:MAG: hypothetical protein EP344_01965 [Bacteroidetes bacterium]|nr:MAG: hypothetical protein EP344_01965 [Bacteroidota bacterium]